MSDDGTVWRKAGGVWTQTGVDLTGDPGSKLHSGEVADEAKPPAGLGNVDDVFLAIDGRWWQKTADATWTLRGDLTGPAGSATFTGSGDPQAGLGKDGDVYVSDDGIVWRKAGGVWTNTGVDLTGDPGATLHSGEVADGAKPPAGLGNVDDVYFASDGRWWQKTADATWTLRGDLTGPAGSATFTGSGDPQAGLGKDGDVYVSDDGTVWRKAGGVWTNTGVDLTGDPGATLHSGEVADGAKPPAGLGNVDDVYFASDGRWWQKTADATWTLRGDLTGPAGSATFTGSGDPQAGLGKDGDVYVSDDGIVWRKAGGVWTNTGVDLTGDPGATLHSGEVADGAKPPAGLGNVDDVYFASDGRWWQKTADATWTLRGDLTGPAGSATFTGSGDPQAGLGKDGDVYVSDDGTLWTRANGVWIYSGVDLTGLPGSKIISGDLAEGASPSPSLGNVEDIFFNLDGRVWEKTDDTTWTFRGDLTGPPGTNLITGVVAPGELPPANVGMVGDTFLAADGRFWKKTDATTWTYIDDLTGPPGGGINPRGQWSSGIDYAVGDSVFRSFSRPIRVGGLGGLGGGSGSFTARWSRSYRCKLAHTSSTSNAPSGEGNTYWDAITGDFSGSTADTSDPGTTMAAQTAYRTNASIPAAPSGTASAIPSPWGTSRPSPTETLNVYGSSRTVTSNADTGAFVSATAWGLPVLVARVQFVYQRSDSSLSAPTGTTAAILAGEGWSFGRLTATSTEGVYRSQRTLTYTTDDGTFESATVWSTPIEIASASGPGTTTAAQTAYRTNASTPAAPSGTAEAIPSPWMTARPSPTEALNVYASSRTVTSNTGTSAFISATAWGTVRLVAQLQFRFRLGTQTPDAPSGGTSIENHRPSGWLVSRPAATITQGVYQTQRTDTYDAMSGVFESATEWSAPVLEDETVAPAVPSGIAISASVNVGGKGVTMMVSGSWSAVAGASSYDWELENVTTDGSTSGTTSGTSFALSNFGIVNGQTLRLRVRSGNASGKESAFAEWVSATVGGSSVTTDTFTGYMQASSTPATPLSSTETPSGWSASDPGATTTLGVYKLTGTRTYHDLVFQSAVWAVTLEEAPIPITTNMFTGYRRASSTPATPSSSTESPSGSWFKVNPGATTTLGVYKLEGTRTYHGSVFQSAVWAVTLEEAPIPITTNMFTGYRRASSTPATPSSSTESPSGSWFDVNPGATTTLGVYKLTGTRTYHGSVFHSAVWVVTQVRGPIRVTTNTFTGYRRGTSSPPTPSSNTESPAISWFTVNPGASTISGIYRLNGTRTYHDGVFHSAVWVVTRVRGPIVVTTNMFTGYRRAISTPATPSSSTESPSGSWFMVNPGATTTLGVYKLTGTRTYHDGVFHSAVWVVTRVSGPIGPTP